MKFRRMILFLTVLLVPLFVAAQEQPAADEKAMMEAWMRAATPGEPHKALQPFVGKFNVKVTSWMAPGAPPLESAGTAENRWILGDRWIEQRFEGTFMDAPFQGIGYTGYDNVKKSYVGTWMDNMSTGMMLSTGSREGNSYRFTATMDDPMTGKATRVEETITVVDDDKHVMEMWSEAPDGSMYKSMEIAYTRKK